MAGRFSFSVPGAGTPAIRGSGSARSTSARPSSSSCCASSAWSCGRWHRESTRPGTTSSLDPRRGARRRGVAAVHLAARQRADIWVVITLAIFWYFGREVEGMVGRARFAVLLLLLTVIPGIVGVMLDIGIAGTGPPVELGRVPDLRRRVPVRPVLLRHPGVGDRRRHRRHPGAAVPRPGQEDAHPPAVRHDRHGGAAPPAAWGWPEPAVDPEDPAGRVGGAARRSGAAPPSAVAATSSPGRGRRRHAAARRGPSSPSPQPPIRPATHDQAELDALLDKISANGMDGLTADEKRRLNELSKRLRNRR